MKVFIIGIAGGTGSRVARLLAEQGDTVSGLYRRPEQAAALQSIGASGTLGDIATISAQELASAASGADVLIFSAGAGAGDNDAMIDMVDRDGVSKAIHAARLSGITRFLLVSVFPEAWRERQMPKSFEHYMIAKKRADVSLVRSELDWVIVRPSALTDESGVGSISLGPAEIHETISRDDLAATIDALIHSPSVRRRILEVTAGHLPVARAVAMLLE